MRGRSTAATAAAGNLEHSTEQPMHRGYSVSRNEKLHLLAKIKRVAASDHVVVGKIAAAGRSSSALGSNAPCAARTQAVRLSSVLQQAPQHFEKFKVAAVERMLTDIDELPEQFRSAEIAYLSKNCLTNLEGIQQFSSLRVLSAADNLLQDIHSIKALTACPGLQVASFEQNPVTAIPNYRQKVLNLLPKLEILDGQAVTPQERAKLHHALQQEAACMAVMMSNACMVHKLARSAELLQLHTELRRTMFGTSSVARLTRGVLPSYIPLDLLKFLKLWDYEGNLSAEEHHTICAALTREVVRVHKQLQKAAAILKGPAQLPALQAWDTAFAKVMLAQQRTIIQLVELVNVLHGEASSQVSKLTGQQPATASGIPPVAAASDVSETSDRQLTADQQLVQERESVIIDLRNAALELAGLLACGETASDAAGAQCSIPANSAGSTPSCPSPIHSQQQQQQQHLEHAPAEQQQPCSSQPATQTSKRLKGPQAARRSTGSASISLRRRSSAESQASLGLRQSQKTDVACVESGPSSSPQQDNTQSTESPCATLSPSDCNAGNLQLSSSPAAASPSSRQELQASVQQALQHTQTTAGRYDTLRCMQSPSPCASHNGRGTQSLGAASRDQSPAGSTSSVGSPNRHRGPLSPTARRMLHHAQQQHSWHMESSWQQQDIDDKHQHHEQRPGHDLCMDVPEHGLTLMQQPSGRWRVLQQVQSAQQLLAAIDGGPVDLAMEPHMQMKHAVGGAASVSSSSTGAMDPPASSARLQSSFQHRGSYLVSHSPGLMSPPSSPEVSMRQEIAVYSKKHWGSRIQSQPTSASSYEGDQQHAALEQLPDKAPRDTHQLAQGASSTTTPGMHGEALPAYAMQLHHWETSSADGLQSSPVAAASSEPMSPSAAEDPQDAATAAHVRLMPAAGAEAPGSRSPSMHRSPQHEAPLLVQQDATLTCSSAQSEAGSGPVSRGASSPTTDVRRCVSWADQTTDQQQLEDEENASTVSSTPAAELAPLFAVGCGPSACSLYSPHVPAHRQQLAGCTAAPQPAQLDKQRVESTVANDCTAQPQRADGPQTGTGSTPQSVVHPSELVKISATAAASTTVAGPLEVSEAVGTVELLSELSGLSNPSPTSVCFDGLATSASHRMDFNALYSVYGEGRQLSDDADADSCQLSTPMSGLSADECMADGPYQTRDLSKPRTLSAGASGKGRLSSAGAHGEISFALHGESPGSSPGEPVAWLAAAAQEQRDCREAAALQPSAQLAQEQEGQQERSVQQQQQELWELLHSDNSNTQLCTQRAGTSSSANLSEAAAMADRGPAAMAAISPAANSRQQLLIKQGAGGRDTRHGASPSHALAQHNSVTSSTDTGQVAASMSLPEEVGSAAAAAPAGVCGSTCGSYSSSMDLSPNKRQLFNSVNQSCHSLLQDAGNLSSMAAQLGAAAGAATEHGSKGAVQASRQALMAKQQRLELHRRVCVGHTQQQVAAAVLPHDGITALGMQAATKAVTLQVDGVSPAARRVLSSSAETASSWAASSIAQCIEDATAAAAAALAAADAVRQTFVRHAPAGSPNMQQQGPSCGSPTDETTSGHLAAAFVTSPSSHDAVAAWRVQQGAGPGVLLGLTPVVPGDQDRSRAGQAGTQPSPSSSDPSASPKAEPLHAPDAIAKALFSAPANNSAGRTAAQSTALEAAPVKMVQQQPVQAAAAALPLAQGPTAPAPHAAWRGGAAVLHVPAAVRPIGACSVPASPAPAAAVVVPGACSVPASPGAALFSLPSSRGSLGRSTAALAELQSQLLTMAVEKAALHRQLQQGRAQAEVLQEKACQSEQLEHMVQQMRGDLQQATNMLQHTGDAVQEQALINQQLQEQMHKLQQQLLTTEAERARQAAADTLARICLCRRMLRHFAAAAAASARRRQLKQAALQHGKQLRLRHAADMWRHVVAQSKKVQAWQAMQQQRRLAAVLAAWAQAVREQRSEAAQQATAIAHWARHTGRRSLMLWLYYTRQVRLLGVDLPSDSTAPSSLTGSPAQPQAPPCKLTLDQAHMQCQQANYRQPTAGCGAARWLGYWGRGQGQPASQPPMQQQDEQQQDTDDPASPGAQPVKHNRSKKQRLSAGFVTLIEAFSGPLSPTKADKAPSSVPASPMPGELPAAARRRLSLGGHEQQLHDRASASTGHMVEPASMVVGDPKSAAHLQGKTAGPSMPRSQAGAAAARRCSESGSGVCIGAPGVPLALQASFVQASRSQRLRRRWLLVKAFNRWSRLLDLKASEEWCMTAAARHAARRLQRRSLKAWRQHSLHGMYPPMVHAENALQQYLHSKQQRLLSKVVVEWSMVCRDTDLQRKAGQFLARQTKRRVQRAVLGVLADNAAAQHVKRCKQRKATVHRKLVLVQTAWCAWADSIRTSNAAAAWQAQCSQQLLARVVYRWQQLCAAATAAAAAGATESRLAFLQERRQLAVLKATFSTWRLKAVQQAAVGHAAAAAAAQERIVELQHQSCHDREQLQQLPSLQQQQAELQQQLLDAAARNKELEQLIQQKEHNLHQEKELHQQKLDALQSEHHVGATVLQEQLQQAYSNADDTMQQLQRLQVQHQKLQLERQTRQQQLEHQVEQQQLQLEKQAQQQLLRLNHQQHQLSLQQQQDHKLVERLAQRKSQCLELTAQLKRCTEKLNGQTQALQVTKTELSDVQDQLRAARVLLRNKSVTMTEKALAAEHGRAKLEHQSAHLEATNRQQQQQLVELQQELERQRCQAEALRAAADGEQRADVLRLQEQVQLKDEVIYQLRDSMEAVQVQLASQQGKVLSEIEELRNGWAQAKQIIKQQRKTIKAQELQLQLIEASTMHTSAPQVAQARHQHQVPQQQPVGATYSCSAAGGPGDAAAAHSWLAGCAASAFPITNWLLTQAQHQQHGQHLHVPGAAQRVYTTAAEAASCPEVTQHAGGSSDGQRGPDQQTLA